VHQKARRTLHSFPSDSTTRSPMLENPAGIQ
jgi:hypothetical protein